MNNISHITKKIFTIGNAGKQTCSPYLFVFDLNDVTLFHKIVYCHVDIDIPPYITSYLGNSRLKSTHLDSMSYVACLHSSGNTTMHSQLYKSFYCRTIHIWNKLPIEARICTEPNNFKRLAVKSFWERLNEYNNFDPP